MKLRIPKQYECSFSITCQPELIPIHGNASAIDEKTDRETEAWIEGELEAGNQWAWCWVLVECRFGRWLGDDRLGGCSYKSEEDFKACGYFEDMKEEAYNDMVQKIRASVAEVTEP